jgi:hypothetical protein
MRLGTRYVCVCIVGSFMLLAIRFQLSNITINTIDPIPPCQSPSPPNPPYTTIFGGSKTIPTRPGQSIKGG